MLFRKGFAVVVIVIPFAAFGFFAIHQNPGAFARVPVIIFHLGRFAPGKPLLKVGVRGVPEGIGNGSHLDMSQFGTSEQVSQQGTSAALTRIKTGKFVGFVLDQSIRNGFWKADVGACGIISTAIIHRVAL